MLFFSKVKASQEIDNKEVITISVNYEIIVGLLALIGSLAGTFGGILTSSKLTAYRIQQLEHKVDLHNQFAERIPIIEEKIKVINHRLAAVEKGDTK